MPLIDHFGLLAPVYERFIAAPTETDWQALLKLPVAGAILDAGGGTGRVAQQISGMGTPLVVLDASIKMLQQAQAKDHLQPACGLSERLPFPDQSFERIMMVDAFHHLEDQHATARELWRVLKPGGRLVIEEPDIRHQAVKWIAIGEKLLLMRSHFWRPERIADLFKPDPCQVQIITREASAWVVVDKYPSPK